MSNLVATPGQSPDFDPPNAKIVHEGDFGATENDEIDLSELWRTLQRRKKIVAVTAGGIFLLATLLTTYQRIFVPFTKENSLFDHRPDQQGRWRQIEQRTRHDV